MPEFKSGFNPFSSENFPTFLIVLIILGSLVVSVFLIEKLLIPRLNPESRFVIWWNKHMFSVDPFQK